MCFVMAPNMAVALRKKIEEMERKHGWTDATVPPVTPRGFITLTGTNDNPAKTN
jgi:hypothetical protein